MKNRKLIKYGAIQAVAILAAVAFTQPVLAICVESEPTAAEMVFSVDANSGCSSINNHFGCTVDKFNKAGFGTCTYKFVDSEFGQRGYIVYAQLDLNTGGLAWDVEQVNPDAPVGVDVTMFGGGFQGNNCGYSFEFDLFGSGVANGISGAGGDCKVTSVDDPSYSDCDTFQNVTSLDVCTNNINESPPPTPEDPPVAVVLDSCQTQAQFLSGANETQGGTAGDFNGLLDDTGIQCPILTNDQGIPIPDGEGNYQQARVIVCNLEVDEYAFGTVGANDANSGVQEQVCCKCGITGDTACFISSEKADEEDLEDITDDLGKVIGQIDTASGCVVEATSDPTQEVILQFQKDRGTDPCEKIRSGGKVYKTCW